MSQITKEECSHLVNAFVSSHISSYTESETRFIKQNATKLLTSPKASHYSCLLRQIYDELGIETLEDVYQPFLKLLEEKFDINRNIVEVGGGIIPCLAKRIALHQQKGIITVYDPRLIIPTSTLENMILKRETFTTGTSIATAQMIIGFMPCDAIVPIIESACKNNIDFMIALCEGGSRRGYEWLETEEEWIDFVETIARRKMQDTTLGSLEATKIQEYSPYPVIYNKRR